MNISVIIGTIGRPSLARSLASIAQQSLGPGDETIVVADGDQPQARTMLAASGLAGTYCFTSPTHCWGHQQRNWGMTLAKGDLLLFLDDDDVYLDGVFEQVRASATVPGIHLYRIRHGKRVIWKDANIRDGNVSTQCVAAFNLPGKLGRWGSRYQGDLDFITQTAKLWGKAQFHENVIAVHNAIGQPS